MTNQLTNVTTGPVRLSYVHLFTPYAAKPEREPKYRVTILLPKSDRETKQRIDAAVRAAIEAGAVAKWYGIRSSLINIPIHDGDGSRPSDGLPFGSECKGHWVFTASSKYQPVIVDLDIQPLLNRFEVYSGMYARVNVNFFPYFNGGKKGIGCSLGPVQKLADGEPLDGRLSAAEAFGDGVGDQVSGYQLQA